MEILIILLLLSLCEKNSELKETLQSALKFYRENRELLQSLYSSPKEGEQAPSKEENKTPSEKNESESLKLIEQFLNRQ